MKTKKPHSICTFLCFAWAWMVAATMILNAKNAISQDKQEVKETIISGLRSIPIKVRMEGPYTARVDLQVVCYFEYTPEREARMKGAPVELDKHLGGIIHRLRSRGEFQGQRLETLFIDCPNQMIPAKKLLLIGLGDESELTLDLMEQVGKASLRNAALVGAKTVAFAPLLRDQGNDTLSVGNVETSVVKGFFGANETEKNLQSSKHRPDYDISELWIEAGPAFYDETVVCVRRGVEESQKAIDHR